MAVIYRPTDRVGIKIDEVTFKVSPLTYEQKLKVQGLLTKENGTDVENIAETTKMLISMCLKDIEGVTYANGEKFLLEFDNGAITDSCFDDLMNLSMTPKLTVALMQLTQGIPDQIVDMQTGKPIEGVEVLKTGVEGTKK